MRREAMFNRGQNGGLVRPKSGGLVRAEFGDPTVEDGLFFGFDFLEDDAHAGLAPDVGDDSKGGEGAAVVGDADADFRAGSPGLRRVDVTAEEAQVADFLVQLRRGVEVGNLRSRYEVVAAGARLLRRDHTKDPTKSPKTGAATGASSDCHSPTTRKHQLP